VTKEWHSLFGAFLVAGCIFYGSPATAQGGIVSDGLCFNDQCFANQPGAIYGRYHIEHATNGDFFTKTVKELSSKEAATGAIFICTAFAYDAVDCTTAVQAVQQGGKAYLALATSNAPQDIHPGIIPPRGYDICQVTIDLYSINGDSTFNASIRNFDDANTQDGQGNLAGPFYIATYISVKTTNEGQWARAKFAVQFVPTGDRVKDHCLPVDLVMLTASGPDNVNYDVPGRHWSMP